MDVPEGGGLPERIGKYVIRRLLGQGGMGRVYHAYDPLIGRDVAIKFMLPEIARSPDLKERFLREARAAGHLRHPNIVTIHDLGEEDGVPYIVMEYLEGEDLDEIIRRQAPLTIPDKLEIIRQVCDALGYAHARGVVHRDIKPSNIRLLEGRVPKVMDFGIAKMGSQSLTQTGVTVGTPHYMAPEQIRGERERIDGRTDIFALGVILYELLFYRRPFEGDNYMTVFYKILYEEPAPVPDLPNLPYVEEIRHILTRALAKDPEDRYPSAYEMGRDVAAVLQRLRAWYDEDTRPTTPAVVDASGGGTPTPSDRAPTPSEVSVAAESPGRVPGRWTWSRWTLVGGGLFVLSGAAAVSYYRFHRRPVTAVRPQTVQTPAPTPPPVPHPAVPPAVPSPSAAVPPEPSPPSEPSEAAETPGRLRIDVYPWAEVLSIRRVSDGWSPRLPRPSYTPLWVSDLRPGEYEIQVSHPRLDRPVTLRVSVESGRTRELTHDLRAVVIPEVP